MYPGGKNQTYQHIINHIPPHQVYIETHLGSGAVMRHKRPSQLNIGIEINPIILEDTARSLTPGCPVIIDGAEAPSKTAVAAPLAIDGDAYRFVNGDAHHFLLTYPFTGREHIYADPPYLLSTRSSQRPLYAYEYTEQDHIDLLNILIDLPCTITLSGYDSDLYNDTLPGWHTYTYTAVTRSGRPAQELLWMNYPPPEALHDYRYLGRNYRERERIKRKKNRWVKRLKKLPPLERQAILWAIQEADLIPDRLLEAIVTADDTS